jgi:Skp family chaperone for outer membrane proteins
MRSVALISLAILLAPLLAAGPTARGDEAFPVALVNMDRVYKTYQPLLDKLAPIKEGVQELEKKAQLRQIELETVVTQLRKAQPGSPEGQRLQQQAGKLQGELQAFVTKEREALQKSEAAAFLETHRQLEAEVKTYAKEKGIKLIIRQQDGSLDENQPLAEILKSLQRGIIYEDGLDITDDILKAMAARNAAGAKP